MIEFRADLAPFSRATAEMMQLVRQLGEPGLALLEAFCAAPRPEGFSVGRVAQVDGVAVMIREPSPALLEFMADLRRRCAEEVQDA